MKKSLLALAALSAIAGAAQAQSSVTVYGILDIGVGGSQSRSTTGAATTASANGVTKTTGVAAFDSGESTSRLGFKGVEDIGGGTSAFFTIELGLNPDSQSLIATGGTQNRQTFVGLKKAGVGDFALGTQYTPIFNAVTQTDPGNTNNFAGNLVYTSDKIGGTAPTGSGANGDAFTIRANQMVTLNSEVIGGFKAHAMAILNNSNSSQTQVTTGATTTVTGGVNNQNGWGLGLDYTWNKLFVTANYQSLTAKNAFVDVVGAQGTISYASGNPVIFGAGQTSVNGTNVQDNQAYVAATYDFGILKAYAQYITRKVMAQQDNNQYAQRSAEQIGVRSFITPTIEAWASGALGRITTNGGNYALGYGQPTGNLTAWQVGSNYWLSKRTNLYAVYGQANSSNVSSVSTAGVAGNPASGNLSTYGVGIRHTF